MKPWSLFDYTTSNGRNPFQEWYSSIEVEAQAELDDTVLTLRAYDDWTVREGMEFRTFKRKQVGIFAIRFWIEGKFNQKKGRRAKRRFRALGLYRPLQREFVFLCGFEKQHGGQDLIPPDALDAAMKYKLDFEEKGLRRDHI